MASHDLTPHGDLAPAVVRIISSHMMFLTTLVITAAAFGLPPQQPPEPNQPISQPLFETHDILRMWLATDLHTVVGDIGRHVGDNEYEGQQEHPATLSYLSPEGDTITVPATVETRGHFRRDRDICDFPPLRLDFDKPDFDAAIRQRSIFANQNRLKLVVHCQDRRPEYEQYALQEYLLYRTYNLLSDKSFRVRLAQITYVDTEARRDSLTRYGFFIEDEDLMARRLGTEILATEGIHPLDVEYGTMTVLAVFEFMMRNTDWSVQGLHNIELLGPLDGLVYPVPFDFDWAGVIAPPYARPDPSLRIRSVRDLHFIGYCRTESEFEEAFSVFNRNQAAIYELHRSQVGLEDEKLRRMLEDYDRFYFTINRPREVERTILRQCLRR
jgi:hypothetical protein